MLALLCQFYNLQGLPWWISDKESSCLCRRCGFDPWVRKISWRRKWQPTPVILPGKFHEWRSLVGYSPWGYKELDTTERLHFCFHFIEPIVKGLCFSTLGILVENINWLTADIK